MRSPHKFTKAETAYIKRNRMKISGAEMSRRLGLPRNSVGQWMRSHGITVPKKIKNKFRSSALQKSKNFARPEDAFIKEHYLSTNVNQLSKIVGRSEQFIKTSLARQGLKIPRAVINKRKKDSQIKTGHVPLNKGKKQTEYMSAEKIARTVSTRFKPGQIPVNALQFKDGDIAIRHGHKDRGVKPYKWIRISLGKWEMLHVNVWKKHNGEIPKGSIVLFKNGDTMNCDINNLLCITREKHAENTRGTDEYVAKLMSYMKGKRGHVDRQLYSQIIKNKPLLDLKRKQLQLKTAINESSLQVS